MTDRRASLCAGVILDKFKALGVHFRPVKKLAGTPTILVLLCAFLAFVFYRFSVFDGHSALGWRVPIDLKIYQLGGAEVRRGEDLYDDSLYGRLPFTYPPFAGAVFQGLTYLSKNWLIVVWQCGMAVALWAVLLMVARERGLRGVGSVLLTALFTVAMLATEPAHGTLYFGQINVFLMLLVSLDFLPVKRRLPGIGVGVAAGLKLTPAYLGLAFLAERRWSAALGAVLTFAVTVGIGFLVVKDASSFWTDAMFNSSRVGEHTNPGAQDIRSVLERVFGITSGPVWILCAGVVVALTVLAVYVAQRRGNRSLAMALTGISSCLISPFSWYHHWVWVMPLALVVLIELNRRLGARLRGLIGSQVAGALSLLASAAVLLPFVSKPVFESLSYSELRNIDALAPWGELLFPGAGVAFIAAYGLGGGLSYLTKSRKRQAAGSAAV